MTHDELPHGLGIRDEELEEALADMQAAIDRIAKGRECLELLLELRPEDRIAMHALTADMVAMSRLAKSRTH